MNAPVRIIPSPEQDPPHSCCESAYEPDTDCPCGCHKMARAAGVKPKQPRPSIDAATLVGVRDYVCPTCRLLWPDLCECDRISDFRQPL